LKNKEYAIEAGSVLLFNPGDNHGCVQISGRPFDYRGFHVPKQVMLALTEEITGKRKLPEFSPNVLMDEEIFCHLRSLHHMILNNASALEKEETFLFLISALIQNYGQPFTNCLPEYPLEMEKACAFIREHFQERIDLDQICRYAGLSKSTLLRAFTNLKALHLIAI
jgi:hypothetical protein